MDSIHQIVREAEENLTRGTTKLGKYVNFNLYETTETIFAYLNSKFIHGDKDSLGRDKPFFNIVTAARNIWYRATDLDRRHIKFIPNDESESVATLLASVVLQRWMDKTGFGKFLNSWGLTLASYGSAVLKFVEKDGELIPSVVPWNRFIADPVDFDALPRIEKFYLTPQQLKKRKEYDQEVVKKLITAKQSRETLEGFDKDSEDNFIEIYEVHGELPDYFLDENPKAPVDPNEVEYRQQMHVVAFMANKDGKFDDHTLFKGKEKKDPYIITHLIEEDGRTLSIGAVEHLFDSQWMKNHSMKQWKDQMDLASKLIFQTSDGNYQNRNVLNSLETGDILVHVDNKPLTLLNNQDRSSNSIQAFGGEWNILSRDITSTPDAMRGNTFPSGTAYRQVAILQQEAGSLFEIMTENKALQLEEILRKFVIPHLRKQLDTKEEIIAILDDKGIAEIDARYVPAEAVRRHNKRNIRRALGLEAGLPTPFMQPLEEAQVKQELAPLGNTRVIKVDEASNETWKEILDGDFWDNVRVEITNENKDKQAVMASLTSIFQTIVGMQGRPMTPDERMVFNAVLNETSVLSPLQMSSSSASPMPPTPQVSPPGGLGALSLTANNAR